MRRGVLVPAAGLLVLSTLIAVLWVGGGTPYSEGDPIEITIPAGASFRSVVDSLHVRGLIRKPVLFRAYARFKGADTQVRSGPYALLPGTAWSEILTILTEGRVLTERLTIPEGFRLTQIAPRIAAITELDPDTVLARLTADLIEVRWKVPGPGLEGYLFPESYRFALGVPLDQVVGAMVRGYREFWTPERLARLDTLGMTERELVTLASIVQGEARANGELSIISSVYHNRLARGQLLQADPTVLYALGGHRSRLLYAAMDSVADHPYNTYTHPGLPPGPICAPGLEALMAALYPVETDFLYFVARTDGTHIFSSTLAEHNRAVAQMRLEWERYRREEPETRR